MEAVRMNVTMHRETKVKGEAAVVAAGMSISEYIRRVMAYAAEGGDLSVIAAMRPSGVRNGVKTV
ncbi:hypothetical protein EVC45_02465 [Paraburkholderia sp. UYCP14C]|uniref:hypothetical protein n=1 Tax=Paraburkholderia sp. UYCP14C TaxID=2511130 RepID=UPI001020D700|nr:hypothetical protein [Paraburkholderia sp. UYCP14C]RZF31336.1 hypothetical protein EVC45_02465 [Paraburkholderia sp. UYCP14C]